MDRQIEHHVDVRLTHFDLVKAAPIVRSYCARHGLPYQQTSWLQALRDSNQHLSEGWHLHEMVVDGRLRADRTQDSRAE